MKKLVVFAVLAIAHLSTSASMVEKRSESAMSMKKVEKPQNSAVSVETERYKIFLISVGYNFGYLKKGAFPCTENGSAFFNGVDTIVSLRTPTSLFGGVEVGGSFVDRKQVDHSYSIFLYNLGIFLGYYFNKKNALIVGGRCHFNKKNGFVWGEMFSIKYERVFYKGLTASLSLKGGVFGFGVGLFVGYKI